jgi:hypothetical protein
MHAVYLLKFINPYVAWLGHKLTAYVGIIRGRSTVTEVTTEFTLLGFLDVQINKKGVFKGLFLYFIN